MTNRLFKKISWFSPDILEYELIKAIPEDLKSNLPTVEEIENEMEEKLK